MCFATLGYARRIAEKAKAVQTPAKPDDGVDWLKRLHSLPDNRTVH